MNNNLIMICMGVVIGGCIAIWIRAIKNYRILKRYYLEQQVSFCLENCQYGLFRTEDFFYMKNDGVSFCEPMESIEYIDYIEGCNFFVGKKL